MAELKQLKGIRMMSRPWEPQDLIDDLQLLIDEEPDRYLNDRRTTLCMARDFLKEHFREVTKKDGCDWCQSLNKPFGEFGLGDMLAIGHVEYTFIGDGRMYQQKVRFCPLCGKNLEEQE